MTDRQRIVFKAILRAAARGKPCPTNPEICGITGASSVSAGPAILDALARLGLIHVERFQHGRQVTIRATGKQTAYTGTRRAHWRDDPTIKPVRRQYTRTARVVETIREEPDVDEHQRVHRDPCPRCGVRADAGCPHGSLRLSMGAFA